MEFRAVLRELRSGDPDSTAKAERELRRRGVTGRLLELARRAADPDPRVRQELAETLPELAGIDARPWLMELSYDENPKVRAAAVTLMATSGDLELLRRVRQVSLDDPDDYTRAQAEKALPKPRR
jgi:HEAT repeat protein